MCSLPQVTPPVAAASSSLSRSPDSELAGCFHGIPATPGMGGEYGPCWGPGTQRVEAFNLQRPGLPAGYKVRHSKVPGVAVGLKTSSK